MNDRVAQMKNIQERMLMFRSDPPDPVNDEGSYEQVVMAGRNLATQLDAETRHVTLSALGLPQAMCRIFCESVLAIAGQDITMPNGTRRGLPLRLGGITLILRDVFESKNELYGDTFGAHGAVGVVIRLLDQVSKIERMTDTIARNTAIAHVANFAVMATMLLVEDDPEFL